MVSKDSNEARVRHAKGTYVVLRRDGAVQVLVKERKFLENIFPDTRNFTEEEDGEETGGDTESASNSTTTMNTISMTLNLWGSTYSV